MAMPAGSRARLALCTMLAGTAIGFNAGVVRPATSPPPRWAAAAPRVVPAVCGEWMYPDEGPPQWVEEVSAFQGITEEVEEVSEGPFAAARARLRRTFDARILDEFQQRREQAMWLAAERRRNPTESQRELRQSLIFGLLLYEAEEALHFVGDFTQFISTNFTKGAVEAKVESLVDRHERRWPLVQWLLTRNFLREFLPDDVRLSQNAPALDDERRLSARSEELSNALDRLWPAVVTKLRRAVARKPALIFKLSGRAVIASSLMIAYRVCRRLRARPQRVYALMNAFLVQARLVVVAAAVSAPVVPPPALTRRPRWQVEKLLRLARLPSDELLVDFEGLMREMLAPVAPVLEIDAPDGDRKTWSAQLQTWSEQLTDLQRSVAKAFGYEDPVPEPTPLRKRDRLFNWFGGSA